jgi:hypothetical protein
VIDARPQLDGYSLDTNIIIDGRVRRYPPDVFTSLWDQFDALIAAGRAIVADEVLWELGRGDDDCHDWCKAQVGLVAGYGDEELEVVAQIAEDFPDWSSERVNWADPFVIAHAATRGWIVVTDEHWSRSPLPERAKIPNVCHHLGVECIGFLDMARREHWAL